MNESGITKPHHPTLLNALVETHGKAGLPMLKHLGSVILRLIWIWPCGIHRHLERVFIPTMGKRRLPTRFCGGTNGRIVC